MLKFEKSLQRERRFFGYFFIAADKKVSRLPGETGYFKYTSNRLLCPIN
jgi:hypothetical protein